MSRTAVGTNASRALLNSITDPLGQVLSQNVYDPVSHRVVSQKDARNKQTLFGWDAYSQTAIRVEIRAGFRLPNLAGSIGRCVAAASELAPAELRRRFAALRWQSPPSFREYQEQVNLARARGWALDSGNLYRGLNSVASLVTDYDGRPRFGFSGVSIAGQQAEKDLEQLGADLHELALLASTSLFPRRPPSDD